MDRCRKIHTINVGGELMEYGTSDCIEISVLDKSTSKSFWINVK